jgi:hypothetical protein
MGDDALTTYLLDLHYLVLADRRLPAGSGFASLASGDPARRVRPPWDGRQYHDEER